MKIRSGWLVAVIVLSLTAALGRAWFVRPARHTAGSPPALAVPSPERHPEGPKAIRFEPAAFEFGKPPVFSGDRVRFDTAVVNTSSTPVVVSEVPRSCGCLTFGEDGALTLPVTLAPGGKLPLRVEYSTDGKTGYQSVELHARGRTAGGASIAEATLTIRGRILASILPLPEDVYIEVGAERRGQPVVRTVFLADEWPGDGLGVGKITSTAGDRMRFELAPAAGNVLVQGLDVRKRHTLMISYSIPAGATVFDEKVTITPAQPSARPATVRLHGRVVADYEIRPDRLMFYASNPGGTASRLLAYHYTRPEFQDVRPVGVPEGTTVAEFPGGRDGVRRFRVTCRLPSRMGRDERELVFRVGSGDETLRVPVAMVVGSE